jgi:hypothetical protein
VEWRQIGFIGDSPDKLQLGLFSDADFAGDRADMRSTSGVFLALYGDHSFFPLSGQSKKQTAVSHSTVEAEIVAADHAIRSSGLPALQLWERLLNRELLIGVYQDNQATARIMTTGRAPTLRHIKRTHSVSVAWIHERVASDDIQLHDCVSAVMDADIFTKHFISRDTWIDVCSLIGIVEPHYMNQICIPTAYVRESGGCACCATTIRIPRAMASPPAPSMGARRHPAC